MGEGGVEAERDHDRRAVGYADRRRERSERLSQPLLCPFLPSPPPATIRERKVAKWCYEGENRRDHPRWYHGSLRRYRLRDVVPRPSVLPVEAGFRRDHVTSVLGTVVPPCGTGRVSRGTNRASASLAPLCNTPSRSRVATHARPPGTRRSLGPAALVSGVGTPPLGLSNGLTQHHRPRARRSVGMWHKMPCATC